MAVADLEAQLSRRSNAGGEIARSMNGKPKATRASDLPQLAKFLRDVFQAPLQARFAAEEMLAWKYLEADPIWWEALSYLLEKDGRLVAHAGVCPVVFRGPDGHSLRCATIIDWAADRGAPGAGLLLYRHLMQFSDATFLIRGTEATQKITSKLGFRRIIDARVYSQWVRPLREFRRRKKDGRALLRLFHGLVHSPFPWLAERTGWEAVPAARFDAAIQPVLASTSSFYSAAERTLAQLNHRLDCPAPVNRGYLLRRFGAVAGYAVVAIGEWEARIVDIRLDSREPEDWAAAYGVVTEALRKIPSVCRIRALASVPLLQWALEANGFWVNSVEPVSFYGSKWLLERLLPMDIQFFESDLGYDLN